MSDLDMEPDYKVCSMPGCEEEARPNQRYCAVCHALYMKGWRAKKKNQVRDLQTEVIKLRKENYELRQKTAEG